MAKNPAQTHTTARQQAGLKPQHGNTGLHRQGVSGGKAPSKHPTVASGGIVPLAKNPHQH